MKFFKKLFNSKSENELIREKLLSLSFDDFAVNLANLIDNENYNLVSEVAKELIQENHLTGVLIGKKSWFLHNGYEKLENIWNKLQYGKIDLDKYADEWKINQKRVYLAIMDYANFKEVKENEFTRVKGILYLNKFLMDIWYRSISKYTETDEIEFQNIIKNSGLDSHDQEVFANFCKNLLSNNSFRYNIGSDGYIRDYDVISSKILDYIPEYFDNGHDLIKFSHLSEKYGVTIKKVEALISSLIDQNLLKDVTLYATDEYLRPRLT